MHMFDIIIKTAIDIDYGYDGWLNERNGQITYLPPLREDDTII